MYDETMIVSVSIQYQTDNPDRNAGVKSHTGKGGMVPMNTNIRLRTAFW